MLECTASLSSVSEMLKYHLAQFNIYFLNILTKCSVQFSRSVVSDPLYHGLQHARTPCPSPTPRVYSNSCPLSQWCHQPSHPLLSPSPPTFNLWKDQHWGLFKWVSSSHQVAKVLEFQLQHQSMNIHDWFPLGLTVLISLQSRGFSRVFSNTTVQKQQFLSIQFSL